MKIPTTTLVIGLLAASWPILALEPRLASFPLLDNAPKLKGPARLSDNLPSNTSLSISRDSGGGFSLFARQATCPDGSYECPHGDCCDNNQNCTIAACCDKPWVGCGADGCYDPDEDVCCHARGTTCPLGWECAIVSGCCPAGHEECGVDSCYDPSERVCCPEDETSCPLGYTCRADRCCLDGAVECGQDKCFNPDETICCTADEGVRAWSCPIGESCCAESGSCYDPETERCCPVGACEQGESCCGNECCSEVEQCGENGYCTAVAATPTPTPTAGGVQGPAETGDAVREMMSRWYLGIPVVVVTWRLV